MGDQKFTTRIVIYSIILLLFLLTFLMIRSIIIPIIFGLLLAYVLQPVYRLMLKKLKSKNLTAAILIILLLTIVLIPIYFLVPLLLKQLFQAYLFVQQISFTDIINKFLPGILSPEATKTVANHINNLAINAFTDSLNSITNIIINVPNLLLKFAVFIFTFYFALRDAEKLKEFMLKLSPFSQSTEKLFLHEFRGITNSVIYGQFIIGLIQGLMVGLGLLVLGVPGTLIFTVIAMIASVIPLLGAWLVWLPVSIYLILSGNLASGLLLFFYGLFFVSVVDNVLRTIFISKTTSLHPALGLIGVIAGLYSFGLVGLILGPLILAYILIIINFYKEGKLNELFKQ